MRIYVASSWRNQFQQGMVGLLRTAGHDVYDFQHPPGGDHLGFSWSDVDPGWQGWSPAQYVQHLNDPIAVAGFESDFNAMQWADACVLLMPCGRSAHLEAGWFVGAGKPLYIVLDTVLRNDETANRGHEAELMYRMATAVVLDARALLHALRNDAPIEEPA
jgi:hypothetical protein